MYLWRRSVRRQWFVKNESRLRAVARDQFAIIERPNWKRLQLEVAAKSRVGLQKLANEFGGRIEKLPRNWLKRWLRQKTKALTIGQRKLVIPAGGAFGTGEHATTAMSLRLLEKLTRNWNPGWSVIDHGTGSGILAFAARILGAGRVVGIDNDPIAISTAKQNARRNKIHGVQFRVSDMVTAKFPRHVDVVTANLFSELLIEILPRIKSARRLILSGILRSQERDLRHALACHKIDILEAQRRGKWVAILAGRR